MNSTNISLRVLVVEDVEDDALLLQNELRRGSFNPQITRVDTPETLLNAMQLKPWDIIFCDYSMPKMNGCQALASIREKDKDVPVIFVSGNIGEDIAVEAMRSGAQDYIMKDNLKRLIPAVQRELKEAQQRQDKRAVESRLAFLTNYDHLTRLPNRILFRKRLEIYLHMAAQQNKQLAVICIDLDRFKNINDSLGYEAGDLVLQEAANRLIACVSSKDVVARFNADEFFVLLPMLESAENVYATVNKILSVMDQPYHVFDFKLYINASLGITLFPDDSSDAESMLRNADIATCRAKDRGGKGYCLYDPDMTVHLAELMEREQAMRRAMSNNEFVLHYQPQIEISSGQLMGMEALVRWNRPGYGLIGPDNFIPLAEETGLILTLGEWVLREACRQACRWRDAGYPVMRVAVNISPLQFHQKALDEQVISILKEFQLDPGWLEIEVTESAIMQDKDAAMKTLIGLQNYGISVSLDDFGTGYSSLSYLKYFKVDNIKIDREFIKDIPHDKDDATITSAVIAMASKLNMKVIAEGVETLQQLDFLRNEVCDLVQGYHIARPMENSNFKHWYQQNHSQTNKFV